MTTRHGYGTLRSGSRIVKTVNPRGGIPTHRLSGRVVAKTNGDLIVQFDDQTRLTQIADAKRLYERGTIRKQGRR